MLGEQIQQTKRGEKQWREVVKYISAAFPNLLLSKHNKDKRQLKLAFAPRESFIYTSVSSLSSASILSGNSLSVSVGIHKLVYIFLSSF